MALKSHPSSHVRSLRRSWSSCREVRVAFQCFDRHKCIHHRVCNCWCRPLLHIEITRWISQRRKWSMEAATLMEARMRCANLSSVAACSCHPCRAHLLVHSRRDPKPQLPKPCDGRSASITLELQEQLVLCTSVPVQHACKRALTPSKVQLQHEQHSRLVVEASEAQDADALTNQHRGRSICPNKHAETQHECPSTVDITSPTTKRTDSMCPHPACESDKKGIKADLSLRARNAAAKQNACSVLQTSGKAARLAMNE